MSTLWVLGIVWTVIFLIGAFIRFKIAILKHQLKEDEYEEKNYELKRKKTTEYKFL